MNYEEAIAYFKEHNEALVIAAKDENVYDYEKKELEAVCMREAFEANEKAIQALEQQPRQGHWIKVTNGRGGHECDVCHDYAPSFQSGNEYLSAFCPNCGADMRGEEDEVEDI